MGVSHCLIEKPTLPGCKESDRSLAGALTAARVAYYNAAQRTGILLGDDSGMLKETAEQFRVTGMTHISAISGVTITIADSRSVSNV